jgi:hypothetical protein
MKVYGILHVPAQRYSHVYQGFAVIAVPSNLSPVASRQNFGLAWYCRRRSILHFLHRFTPCNLYAEAWRWWVGVAGTDPAMQHAFAEDQRSTGNGRRRDRLLCPCDTSLHGCEASSLNQEEARPGWPFPCRPLVSLFRST